MKKRLTKEQSQALKAYNFAVMQEDRYLGSVFVTEMGKRKHESLVAQTYEKCKALGMTHEHGL